MPRVSLVLGRRTLHVYELDRPTVRIGRSSDTDIAIDNLSVSRHHAEIVRTETGWAVRDTGSANGTFLNGRRLEEPRELSSGDEISIGKFSIFFDRVVGDGEPSGTGPQAPTGHPAGASPGTMHIRASDVKELQRASAERRKAALTWNAGGREGERTLPDEGALLVGRDELCDLRVPGGPRHHLLFTRTDDGWEVRDLAFWSRMKVGGRATRRARLSDGDRIDYSSLEITYAGALE